MTYDADLVIGSKVTIKYSKLMLIFTHRVSFYRVSFAVLVESRPVDEKESISVAP
jgi:hypothetical protein